MPTQVLSTMPSQSVLSATEPDVQLALTADEREQAWMELMDIFDLALDISFGAESES